MTQVTYQPSSSEKKTVVLIYLLIGSMMILHKDHMNNRVWKHLQQALGWRICFVIVALLSLLLVFIPFLSLIPLLLLVVFIGLWGWFVYQARTALPAHTQGGLSIFTHIGKRMIDLIDIHPDIQEENTLGDTETPS